MLANYRNNYSCKNNFFLKTLTQKEIYFLLPPVSAPFIAISWYKIMCRQDTLYTFTDSYWKWNFPINPTFIYKQFFTLNEMLQTSHEKATNFNSRISSDISIRTIAKHVEHFHSTYTTLRVVLLCHFDILQSFQSCDNNSFVFAIFRVVITTLLYSLFSLFFSFLFQSVQSSKSLITFLFLKILI